MSDLREYIHDVAKGNADVAEKLREIQGELTSQANDIEANAMAIEELAEIIGGGE